MAKTTIKQLQEQIVAQQEALEKAVKLLNKSNNQVAKSELKVSETEWKTIEGTFKNQISLAPFKIGGKYKTPSVYAKFSQPATKAGLDKIRAIIDIAESKLDEAGILTA